MRAFSEVHGNFIVNEGAATADEVLELIGQIQATVRKERGIELETGGANRGGGDMRMTDRSYSVIPSRRSAAGEP